MSNKIVTQTESAPGKLTTKQAASALVRGVSINLLVLIPCTIVALTIGTLMIAVTSFDLPALNVLGVATFAAMVAICMFLIGYNLAKLCQGPPSVLAVKKSKIFVVSAAIVSLPLFFFTVENAAEYCTKYYQIPFTLAAALVAYGAGQIMAIGRLEHQTSIRQRNPVAELDKHEL